MADRLKAYRQEEGQEKIREIGHIDLSDAVLAVRQLKISPANVEIPEMVGFQRDRSFIEFTKLANGEYQVRYENPGEKVYLIGSLPEQKAIDCLTDFFKGERPRWCDELEEY
jgi:hypothetical protein